MNNTSPTPRRYTSSRPDFRNNVRFTSGTYGDNINVNPREKLIPREYYENARNVDELLYEIRSLNRQLYEQQAKETKLNKLCEKLKDKLNKYYHYRELALRYKQQRNELSERLYKRNVFDDDDDDEILDDASMRNNIRERLNNINDENLDDSDEFDDNKLYVSKRRSARNKIHGSKASVNKTGNEQAGQDSETKELISKLYEMISSLKEEKTASSTQLNATSPANNVEPKGNHTTKETKYLSERELDIIKTEELKKLEDAVQDYRTKLEARKAYERRKISAQQEISQIQEELRGLDTGRTSINDNTSNNNIKSTGKDITHEPIRHRSRNKSRIRERFDDLGSEYDESAFFQGTSSS